MSSSLYVSNIKCRNDDVGCNTHDCHTKKNVISYVGPPVLIDVVQVEDDGQDCHYDSLDDLKESELDKGFAESN